MTRRLLPVLVGLLLVLAPPTSSGSAATNPPPEVTADDEADAYVGHGGLVLPPGSADDGERRRVAACEDCRWRLTDPCAPDGGACLSVTHGCPRGRLLRAWVSIDGGATWQPVGLPCIGPAGPVTVETAGSRLAEDVAQAVAPATIRLRPPRGVLPRLPVLFRPSQPVPGPIALTVLGRRAIVETRPTWDWAFGDGTTGSGAADGGGAAHAYAGSGTYEVRLGTTWHASYTVDGLGPFALAPLHQQAILTLRVGSGRATLVS